MIYRVSLYEWTNLDETILEEYAFAMFVFILVQQLLKFIIIIIVIIY